ncbi:MAG: AraC family transcriptional regulator [Eubacteriales bacterium]|nr:AraC family transcriptional regulator [Eubacteriales bacterium]
MMFQNITFVDIDSTMAFDFATFRNGDKYRTTFASISDFYPENQGNVDFVLDGHGKFLYIPPANVEARTLFLVLHAFGLFDAGPRYMTNRSDYASYLLLYTYDGNGTLEYDGNTYHLTRGDGFFIDCNLPQRYYTSGNHWYHSTLHFSGSTAAHYFDRFYSSRTPLFHISNPGLYQTNLENLLRACQNTILLRDEEISALLQIHLLDIMKEKFQSDTIPAFIVAAKSYLDTNFATEFSLDQLAGNVNMSKYHLSREFNRYLGLTISDYLIQLRLNQSCMLMQTTQLPVQVIAQLSGFQNYSNFYKQFQKKFGFSPNQYRRRLNSHLSDQ